MRNSIGRSSRAENKMLSRIKDWSIILSGRIKNLIDYRMIWLIIRYLRDSQISRILIGNVMSWKHRPTKLKNNSRKKINRDNKCRMNSRENKSVFQNWRNLFWKNSLKIITIIIGILIWRRRLSSLSRDWLCYRKELNLLPMISRKRLKCRLIKLSRLMSNLRSWRLICKDKKMK